MIKICLYLKETPDKLSQQKILELSRVPAMGEFIELDLNVYRVFLVCHNPNKSEYQASVAVLKTEWDNCEPLIDRKQRV